MQTNKAGIETAVELERRKCIDIVWTVFRQWESSGRQQGVTALSAAIDALIDDSGPPIPEMDDRADLERRRCIGVVLAEYGIYKLAGEERIAHALDRLATKLEHGDEAQE